MRFRSSGNDQPLTGQSLVYRDEEYSFDTTPARRGFTSILIGDISLEIDELGMVTSVWGFCPYMKWLQAPLFVPEAAPGALFALSDKPFEPGVSRGIEASPSAPVVDTASGWILIDLGQDPAAAVQIFRGVILELDAGNQLARLWLSPENGLPADVTRKRR